MGCDIHSFAETKNLQTGKWEKVGKVFIGFSGEEKTECPFDWRSYGLFGFLANIYNRSESGYVSETKGLPNDSEYLNGVSEYAYERNPMNGKEIPIDKRETVKSDLLDSGYWGFTYLTLKELLDWNYEKTFLNKRGEPNEEVTYRDFLGTGFFREIETLKTLGESENVRIVFWFDN